MAKTKSRPKTLLVIRTFGWDGDKWIPGKRFPANHEKVGEFIERGYLRAPKGFEPHESDNG